MATITPSSTVISHRSQRPLGTESKSTCCTYQMLSGSPFACSAETCRKRLSLAVSPATQQLTPSAERTLVRGNATILWWLCALSGAAAWQGALTDLLASESPRNLGLSDSALLHREKEEANPQAGWLRGSCCHRHPASPWGRLAVPTGNGFLCLSPFRFLFFAFPLPPSHPFLGVCSCWRRENLPLLPPLQRKGRLKMPLRNTSLLFWKLEKRSKNLVSLSLWEGTFPQKGLRLEMIGS